MLIGVISDTHGAVAMTRPAIDIFQQAGVERVLHCGDIGSRQIIELFDRWETHFVFGNVDHDEVELRSSMLAAGHVCHERFGDFTWSDRRIALLHGNDYGRYREVEASNEYDLVCSGHTHEKTWELAGRTRLLNPGAIFRVTTPTVAIVELDTLEMRFVVVPR